MRKIIAILILAFGLAGSALARDAGAGGPVRREHGVRHHGHDARLHSMQRLQRKHDLRRPYGDRRPHRRMRSL